MWQVNECIGIMCIIAGVFALYIGDESVEFILNTGFIQVTRYRLSDYHGKTNSAAKNITCRMRSRYNSWNMAGMKAWKR
jgi:hypothetical protein